MKSFKEYLNEDFTNLTDEDWINMGFNPPGEIPPGAKPVRYLNPYGGGKPLPIYAHQLPAGVVGTSIVGPPKPDQTDPITRDPVPNTEAYAKKMKPYKNR